MNTPIVPRAVLLTGLITAMLAVGCVLPSDRSNDLRLAIDSVPSMSVDDTVQLGAHPLRSAGGVIRASDYLFTSRDPRVLEVSASGVAVAKDTGTVTVVAQLRFSSTPPDSMKFIIGDSIRILSVTAPSPLYFGDTLVLHGIGLNPARTTFTIGGLAALVVDGSFIPDVPGRAGGPATLLVLVPPAPSPALVTARRGQVGTSYTTPLAIVQGDRLEPNDSQPHFLGVLNAALGFTSLLLEGTASGSPPARDWYTFTNPKSQAVTIVLKPDGASLDEVSVTLSDTLDASGSLLTQGPHAWAAAVGSSACQGTVLNGFRGVLDSQVLAMPPLPPGTYHLMVTSRQPSSLVRAYTLRIKPEYDVRISPGILPALGGSCASPLAGYVFGTANGFLPQPLSLDNPGATGWLTFVDTVPGYYSFDAHRRPVDGPAPPGMVVDVLLSDGTLLPRNGGVTGACLAAGTFFVVVRDTTGVVDEFALNGERIASNPCP